MDDNKIREIRLIRENPRFRRYPEYKESGVEWIGKFPKNWEVKRLKYVADLNMGQSPPSEEYNSDQIGTPFLQGNAEFGKHHPTPKIYCPTAKKHASSGDILLSVRAPVGALNSADQEYGIGRGLCAIRPRTNQLERHYAKYLLEVVRTELYVVATGSTYDAVTVDDVSNLTCVVPPLSEQTQIADFLDQKTEQIDELIRIKERRIELLQEQRTALINQAVTKGLDPNVEMKPSGVEWIGEIPKHWEVKKIKHVTTFVSEKSMPETDAIKISPENVESKTGKVLDFYSSYDSIGVKFQVGDVLFNKIRVYLNKVVFAEYDGYSLGEMIIIRPSLQDISKYLFYLMLSNRFIEYCNSISRGAKMPRTDVYDILNAQIPIPSYQEQTQIVNFLDCKTQQIDELMNAEQRKIELLKEYRQSLISEAVTGKIDVRDKV